VCAAPVVVRGVLWLAAMKKRTASRKPATSSPATPVLRPLAPDALEHVVGAGDKVIYYQYEMKEIIVS
jgi:hypothetical protein